jgi:hypothetical protein
MFNNYDSLKKELNDYYNDFSKFTNSNKVEEIWSTFKTQKLLDII